MSDAEGSALKSSEAMDFLPEELQERWRKVRGWLLPDGARRLYEASAAAPTDGRIVEIGSYAGKSTLCIAWPHRNRKNPANPPVVAIDPKFQSDYRANLEAFGIDDKTLATKELSSLHAADVWVDPISFLYIDGHHGVGHAAGDFVAWEPYVLNGCVVALDDTAGHIAGPVRLVRMAVTSGAFDRLYEVDGITFLRKKRSLFPGLGRFPPERETIIADLAAVAGWTGAMDPDLLMPCPPGENLETLNISVRQRHQRWVLSRYKSSQAIAASPEMSATFEYLSAIIALQLDEMDAAISMLHKLETLPAGTQLATHALDLSPFVVLRLGQAYDLAGKRDEALSYYERARSDGRAPELRETAARLLKVPFARQKLRNDLLLREYVTAGAFAKYRTY